jgi:hypothetical protein
MALSWHLACFQVLKEFLKPPKFQADANKPLEKKQKVKPKFSSAE